MFSTFLFHLDPITKIKNKIATSPPPPESQNDIEGHIRGHHCIHIVKVKDAAQSKGTVGGKRHSSGGFGFPRGPSEAAYCCSGHQRGVAWRGLATGVGKDCAPRAADRGREELFLS